MKRSKLTVIAEVLVTLALIGAFMYFTLASANAQEICTTTCIILPGGIVDCTTICY